MPNLLAATTTKPAPVTETPVAAATEAAPLVETPPVVPAPDSSTIAPTAPAPDTSTTALTVQHVEAAAPAIQPVVAEGRTELSNGIYAVRSGDTIRVFFDTPEARTRRPEKFEQVVRATLPAVHGTMADSMLARIGIDSLVGAADLLTDLPSRGIQLRSADGREIALYPETRPGRDGPLVVAYRVVTPR
jgi:hypothetical protein